MGFDGDATLAFQVHGIEDLGLHFARSNGASQLQQAVAESRFAVVNMGDDGEIADVGAIHAWAGVSILAARIIGIGSSAHRVIGSSVRNHSVILQSFGVCDEKSSHRFVVGDDLRSAAV